MNELPEGYRLTLMDPQGNPITSWFQIPSREEILMELKSIDMKPDNIVVMDFGPIDISTLAPSPFTPIQSPSTIVDNELRRILK